MSPKLEKRINALSRTNLNSFQVDPFGFDPDSIKRIAPFGYWLYKNYFRCETFGASHVPSGRVIVIANHSGQLPFDAMMIGMAFMLEPKLPRVLRGMAERWSAELPFINTLFSRGGTVVGEPGICKELLRSEESVLVFPEGVRGIAKLFKDRYKLVDFGTGFMRLALETQTPILPVALIGAEEQAPSIAKFEWLGKLLKVPADFPLIFPQIIPFPLPVKYRIYIGKPMYFPNDRPANEETVELFAHRVQNRVQDMVDQGLRKRRSVFF